jgi:hypothetical protein
MKGTRSKSKLKNTLLQIRIINQCKSLPYTIRRICSDNYIHLTTCDDKKTYRNTSLYLFDYYLIGYYHVLARRYTI